MGFSEIASILHYRIGISELVFLLLYATDPCEYFLAKQNLPNTLYALLKGKPGKKYRKETNSNRKSGNNTKVTII